LSEVCDLAFMIRAEQVRRTALAEMQLAPYTEEGQQLTTPDGAVAEFEAWLNERPNELDRDDDELELFSLLGVR
jgi:hypothetical protein